MTLFGQPIADFLHLLTAAMASHHFAPTLKFSRFGAKRTFGEPRLKNGFKEQEPPAGSAEKTIKQNDRLLSGQAGRVTVFQRTI